MRYSLLCSKDRHPYICEEKAHKEKGADYIDRTKIRIVVTRGGQPCARPCAQEKQQHRNCEPEERTCDFANPRHPPKASSENNAADIPSIMKRSVLSIVKPFMSWFLSFPFPDLATIAGAPSESWRPSSSGSQPRVRVMVVSRRKHKAILIFCGSRLCRRSSSGSSERGANGRAKSQGPFNRSSDRLCRSACEPREASGVRPACWSSLHLTRILKAEAWAER